LKASEVVFNARENSVARTVAGSIWAQKRQQSSSQQFRSGDCSDPDRLETRELVSWSVVPAMKRAELSRAALRSSPLSQQHGGDAISTIVKRRSKPTTPRTILDFAAAFMFQADLIVFAMPILLACTARTVKETCDVRRLFLQNVSRDP